MSPKKASTVFRLFRYILRHYPIRLGVVAICIVVSSLTSLASSLFTRTLIDDYIMPLLSGPADYHPLFLALLRLAAVILVGIVAAYSYNLIMIFVAQGTMKGMRTQAFSHMQRLPLAYFDAHAHGDIMSVYTNDIDTLRQVIGNSVPRLLQSLVTIVATFVSMLVMNIPLTLVSLLIAGLMFYTTRRLGMLSRKYFVERQRNIARVNGFIEEMVSGQRVVKVYCHEEQALASFSALNEQLRSSADNANKISNAIMPINSNIGNFGYVFLAIVGAALALGGVSAWWACGLDGAALSVGTLVSFLTLHRNFTRPVSQISNEINSIAMASAGTDRYYSLLDEQAEEDAGKVVLESQDATWQWRCPDGETHPLEGLVELDAVDFAYIPEHQVLFSISLTAYPGQQIAFVGGTGAGKTTITNLINRFYEIADGSIRIDGINVRDIEKDSLRRSLGVVLQETKLFSGTVMENIRYGRPEATDAECVAAARLVYADSFIRRLPQGYQTLIKPDEGMLSQGERQLLSIARTAVANPPVLILDEATSSIDTRTERLIQKGMDSLMKGRTSFVIAHRLSTVQHADYIAVMDHGRIIERGKHHELLELRGKYYELYTGNQLL